MRPAPQCRHPLHCGSQTPGPAAGAHLAELWLRADRAPPDRASSQCTAQRTGSWSGWAHVSRHAATPLERGTSRGAFSKRRGGRQVSAGESPAVGSPGVRGRSQYPRAAECGVASVRNQCCTCHATAPTRPENRRRRWNAGGGSQRQVNTPSAWETTALRPHAGVPAVKQMGRRE